MTPASNRARHLTLYAALAYLIFIIYGSLVPLDFHARSWDDAVHAFANIRFLHLGIASRADWIANILLYMPLTFLWAQLLGRDRHGRINLLALLSVLTAAIGVAFAVEFTQLYFPQRTVSINDLLAESIGSVAGVLLWCALGSRVERWLADLRGGGNAALVAALSLYLLAYLGFSFFPFDFVVSSAELANKLAQGKYGWLLADAGCSGGLRCLGKLTLELLVVVPLGIMLAFFLPGARRSRVLIAALAGAALGAMIEVAQLFLNSGIAEGLSVLVRMLGAALGSAIYQHVLQHRTLPLLDLLRRQRWLIVPLAPLYLAALVHLQNWPRHGWRSWEQGWAQLSSVHFLPFYYHYFTTETAALISLWLTAVAYAPVGMLLFWAHGRWRQHGCRTAALLAALLASVLECVKLFQPKTHPDPTNILIAAAAAASAYALLCWGARLYAHSAAAAELTPTPAPTATALPPTQSGALLTQRVLALVAGATLVWAVLDYPLGSVWLGGGLLIYLVLLRRWPHAWIVIVPALLPVLDLTPWSGRLFFDEFDCLLLATVAIAAWRSRSNSASIDLSRTAFWLLSLFVMSSLLALGIGIASNPLPDLNAFNNYYSAFNALRVAKGLLWALLLLPLLQTALAHDSVLTLRRFAFGMTLGVLVAGIAVLWERLAFTGLLDFANGYRVVGMFSGMHTGGAYIEGYFATALPLVAWWTLRSQRWPARLFGAAVFVLGSYGLLVTYARGGYIALVLALVVLVLGSLCVKGWRMQPLRSAGAVGLLLALAALAWPVLQGSVMQQRFATTKQDVQIRGAHWQDAVRMMDDGIGSTAFGMGLGRYPHTYFWRNSEGVHPATYRIKQDGANTYLTLGAGDPLYVEQLVAVQAAQKYRVSFVASSRSEQAQVSLPLCQKWMLYAADCIWKSVDLGPADGVWRRHTFDFNSAAFAAQPWYAQRSVKLSIFNPVSASVVSIDQLSMQADDGTELLQNGDFTQGLDHWFFSTDNHLPWHFKNLWLQLYFEQGAVGLLLFAALLLYTGLVVLRRYREPELPIVALAAALTGFLTVGVVDSLFDAPRMALLFYLLVSLVIVRRRQAGAAG